MDDLYFPRFLSGLWADGGGDDPGQSGGGGGADPGADGGAGPDSGGGERPNGGPDGDKAVSGGSGKGDEGPQRPDWLAEKFWKPEELVGEDGKLDYAKIAEQQANARKAAETRLFTRTDDLKKALKDEMAAEKPVGVPEKAEDYKAEINEAFKRNFPNLQVEIDEDDPLLGWFRQTAYKHGIPQSEFNDMVNMYLMSRAGELPDYDEQMEALGDKGELRVERINQWAGKVLSEESHNTLNSLAVRAPVVTLIEELMELAGEPSLTISEDGNSYNERLTKEDLMAMQNDPRYYRDADPAFVARVKAGFKKLTKGAA